jgi:hypothetical protein
VRKAIDYGEPVEAETSAESEVEQGSEVEAKEPVAAPSMLNVEHLRPRIQQIIMHVLANQGIICDYPSGSFEAHWHGAPDEASSIKVHLHVYPRI